MGQIVYIYKCSNSTIKVEGKVNSIVLGTLGEGRGGEGRGAAERRALLVSVGGERVVWSVVWVCGVWVCGVECGRCGVWVCGVECR